MHYANGRPVQKGDEIAGMDANGRCIGGVVCDLHHEAETCNIGVIPLAGGYIATCTAGDCLHIEDISAAGAALMAYEEANKDPE